MNKAELLQLLQTTELSPEALSEIAAVVQRHRGKAHDSAMETISDAPLTNAKLLEVWRVCYGDLKQAKTRGMKTNVFEAKMQSSGFSKLFTEIKGDDDKQIIFLTDKNGVTWVLPLNHSSPAYLPGSMFDNDAIQDRFDSMKELVAPCRGKFEEEYFRVEAKGKVI